MPVSSGAVTPYLAIGRHPLAGVTFHISQPT